MLEARATIDSIEQTKMVLEKLGAHFQSEYVFTDIIYAPKDQLDFQTDFVRVRIYTKNNRPTKVVNVIRKQTKFQVGSKSSKTIFKKEFDTKNEALSFLNETLPDFEKRVEYDRIDWQYQLEQKRIFLEDIKGFKPSIEIEAETNEEIEQLFNKLSIKEVLKESIAEVMRKLAAY